MQDQSLTAQYLMISSALSIETDKFGKLKKMRLLLCSQKKEQAYKNVSQGAPRDLVL